MKNNPFEPAYLEAIPLKNRVIRSATHEGMADERGWPGEELKNLYRKLAKGDVGAIITGYAGVQADGKCPLKSMLMIDTDDAIPAYRELVAAVHEHDTPIILQIAHCGRQTRSKVTGLPTVAPSALRDKFYNEDKPQSLSEAQIEALIENFVAAIVRGKQAGFDAVQLHLAHGYLLAEFLSSYSNRRKDRWGGSIENKYRIVGEIFRRARLRVGDYPILAKINAHDGRKKGMRTVEAAEIAKLLEKSGCAAIEVSCGVIEDGFYTMRGEKLPVAPLMQASFKYMKLPGLVKSLLKPAAQLMVKQPRPLHKYNFDATLQIKSGVQIPVIIVGGIHSTKDIDNCLAEAGIDFISMCRPFIIEPNIVKKFKCGESDSSRCIMCNYCVVMSEDQPLKCYYGKLL